MSITAIGNVFNASPSTLNPSEVLVLLALADYTNDEGISWPGIDRIAQRSHLSRRQTIRVLASLEKAGEITITRRDGPRGSSSNEYLLKSMYWDDKSEGVTILHPHAEAGSNGVSPMTRGGDTHDTGGVSPVSPDPLLDPSVDPNNTFARILQKWRETFPEKPQPRANSKTLQAKFKARMKSPHFRTNWEQALVVSTKSEFLRNSSWFDLG